MYSFILSMVALVVGYFVYGKIVDRIFGSKADAITPAKRLSDGVDYIELDWKKAFLIQFLNIAGTGPIFGAVAGAMWGPVAFLWIVFGCIFAGAVHDFLIGMMSLRDDGATVAEIVGKYLGNGARTFMRFFSVILLLLVGVVFIMSPADILNSMTGINRFILIGIIIIYYMLATILPVDKIIGKIYPLFGGCLLIMAAGIAIGILGEGYHVPEIVLKNLHPDKTPIFPYLFISIACGAISGFHATQSPMMARCLKNEKEGRRVFYGSMIAEGIVACPITSGDTAFRSARMAIADALQYKQGPFKNRFIIAIPLFIIGIGLCFIDFQIIWRYFAWSNQTLATIALWAAAKYLATENKNYWIAAIPGTFMTVVVTSYIIIAKEGLRMGMSVGIPVGLIVALCSLGLFLKSLKKKSQVA
ncbi:carbon starvation CstA family protein [Cetobacterium sp. SF1]|uniref:carbon starvation CstA family protein n=1 Tax=Cetobacterium sp. SF1 TaxID=3417654 RepID=UPI003CEDF3B6